jgi:hypothetical protein
MHSIIPSGGAALLTVEANDEAGEHEIAGTIDPADGSAREDAAVAHQVIGGAIGEDNVEV